MSAETDFAAALVREKNARITQLEADVAELVEALTKVRKGLDLVDPARPLQYAGAMDLMRKCADEALARIQGDASGSGGVS